MTYQPNPDAPIASEQHPELYERMCKAHQFIREVLVAYIKARKANGMTRPFIAELATIQEVLYRDVDIQFFVTAEECWQTLGETFALSDSEFKTIIEGVWNGK